jgi:hypothetical protein
MSNLSLMLSLLFHQVTSVSARLRSWVLIVRLASAHVPPTPACTGEPACHAATTSTASAEGSTRDNGMNLSLSHRYDAFMNIVYCLRVKMNCRFGSSDEPFFLAFADRYKDVLLVISVVLKIMPSYQFQCLDDIFKKKKLCFGMCCINILTEETISSYLHFCCCSYPGPQYSP